MLHVPFYVGDFKEVKQKVIAEPAAATTEENEKEGKNEEEESEDTAVFSCPQGCIRVFQRLSSLERHLSLDACTKALER